jgi:hypothetical protein
VPISLHPSSYRLGQSVGGRAGGEGMTAPSPTRRRWTSEEEQKLDQLLDAGMEAAEISVILNRSRQAIYALLQRRYRKQTRLSTLSRSGLKAKK